MKELEKLRKEYESLQKEIKTIKSYQQKNKALIDNIHFMEALLDAVPNPVFYKDAKGRYIGCNKSFSDQLGVSNDEIKGKTVFELWPSKLSKKYHEKDMELLKNPEKQVYKWKVKDKNGKEKDVIFYKNVFYNENKEIAGLVGAYTDISDLEQTKESLHITKDRLQRLADNISDGVTIIENQKVVYTNRKICEIFDCNNEELQKKTPLDFAIPEEKTRLKKIMEEKKAKKQEIDTLDFWIETHSGQRKYIHNRYSYIKVNDKITNRFIITSDFTDRKHNEESLRQAKELAEVSDRLKSAFLANMSHEIRTPLNGILGFTQLLKDQELSNEDKERYIDIIEHRGNHLLTIINDIIDISKIEANQLKVNFYDFNLNEMIYQLFSVYGKKLIDLGKTKINLQKFVDLKDQDSIIVSDQTRLEQLFNNLLSNAIKFTEEGYIKFGYTLEKRAGNKNILFFVKDTGIGIEKSQIPDIFERFNKLQEATRGEYGGNGLGLAISRGIVEVLDGEIWVESETGVGSTFYFSIPYKTKTDKDITSQIDTITLRKKDFKKKKVLIVEDDETNILYLSEILKRMNTNVLVAEDGVEAIKKCKSDKDINLVLMDIKLPKMNGYDASKEIKKIRPKLPIIAQTAYAMINEKEKCLDAGCDEYLAKPINKNDLISILQLYL
jgi:hypothetical protein